MISFTLPIIPTAQARPRFSKWGTHKSKTQEANERTLEAWLLEHTPKTPLEGPLCLEFVAALPVPRSASKKAREAMLCGFDYPVKRPDTDNLCKQLLDACTRLQFWRDDSQVVRIVGEKIYAEKGYWEIVIYEAASAQWVRRDSEATVLR